MVAVASTPGKADLNNGAVPCEGTRAYPFNLDFTTVNAYLIDLTQQYTNGQFTTLQTAFIDNSSNPAAFELICNSTSQVVVCPPFSQGFFTLLIPSPPKLQAQTNGLLVMEIILLNFYIPPAVWSVPVTNSSGLPQVDVPALDAVISGGKVQVQSTQNPTTLTNKSGTITLGGTGQLLVAGNASGQDIMIENPTTATEILQWSPFAIGGPWFDIAAGQLVDKSGITNSVWVRGATTGHAFTAAAG